MTNQPLDEASLRALVGHFYARVRADPELGPIFNQAISDWPEHLEKLTDFWCSVMMGTGRYKGQPLPAHMKHRDQIRPELFDRWLSLWRDSTDAHMALPVAQALQAKAARIAESLKLALFFRLEQRRTAAHTKPEAA